MLSILGGDSKSRRDAIKNLRKGESLIFRSKRFGVPMVCQLIALKAFLTIHSKVRDVQNEGE